MWENMPNIQKKIQTKLTKGLLDLIILQLLDESPLYGYKIMATIRKSYGILVGASTIYPILNTLETNRLVKSEWNTMEGHPRRIYQITNDGRNLLQFSKCSLNQICQKIDNAHKNLDEHVKIGLFID